MKDLYQPVFWCGFALSLSALYASAEKLASGSESAAQKPVLMQISIGEPVQGDVNLGPQEDIQEAEKDDLSSSEFPPQPDGDLTPPLPSRNSAFFEAAKAAMQSP